jgi:hypothetical protein
MAKRSGYSTTYFARRRLSGQYNAGIAPGPTRAAPEPVNDVARPQNGSELDGVRLSQNTTPTGGATNGHPGGPLKPPPGASRPPLVPNSGPSPVVLPPAPTVNPRTGRPFRNPDDATKVQLNGATAFSPSWDATDPSFTNLPRHRYANVNDGLQALSKALGSQVNLVIMENNNDYRTKPPTGPACDGLFNPDSRDVIFNRRVTALLTQGFTNGFNTEAERYALHVAIHELTHAKDPMMENARAWIFRYDEAKDGQKFQLLVEGMTEYRARQLTIRQFGRGKPRFGAYNELSDGIRLYTRMAGNNAFENLWGEKTLNKRIKHFETNLEAALRSQVEPSMGKVAADSLMHTLRPKFTKFITDQAAQRQVNGFLDRNDGAGLGKYLQGIAPNL